MVLTRFDAGLAVIIPCMPTIVSVAASYYSAKFKLNFMLAPLTPCGVLGATLPTKAICSCSERTNGDEEDCGVGFSHPFCMLAGL